MSIVVIERAKLGTSIFLKVTGSMRMFYKVDSSGQTRGLRLTILIIIVKKCQQYTAGGDKCDVCLSEKLAIMKDKDSRSINKRTELMNKCRHKWHQNLAGNKKL